MERPGELGAMPTDWRRGLVVVAHPDDIEYGAAAAVAAWTAAGRDLRYVLATRGEAGIAGLAPAESGPLREAEQRASAAVVGVTDVEFLDHPDGRLESGLRLRRDVAAALRRHRPELVVTLNHRDVFAPRHWNSSDHRILGRTVLDAVADAANEWIFPELADAGFAPWDGVRWVAAAASPEPTHSVDVTGFTDLAVESLSAHRRYLEALSSLPVAEQARGQIDAVTRDPRDPDGPRTVAFELFPSG
ncbi:LmbE family N-acetylglucosaminyl deacetylase [Murinocardiopsis flavida]|uniref:LmbE family N-acetylglucosaminyl deacetylase n=1 Tax=Murinocardiopsis flavida TaxID=645275 RepID=A0A2P8D998_9ACTN|nr:PIG-L deacetylase family protein [Murinocardiopsis flavida]PSK93783.1 LmbE family N-acetylglucosaminyl deacetylase [Murinocardiopsis flavida]